jgi:hypothetical protein
MGHTQGRGGKRDGWLKVYLQSGKKWREIDLKAGFASSCGVVRSRELSNVIVTLKRSLGQFIL